MVIKNASGKDVTANLKITKKDGTIKIKPATLTVTTPDASKAYDGTALTAAGTISGFVNGETATFVTTGTQTEVGKSDNTYSINWNGTAKESNYSVVEAIGTLEITTQSIVPETPSYKGVTVDNPTDVVYDGEQHKWEPEVKDKDGKVLTDETDYEVSYDVTDDNFTDVKTINVTITGKGNYEGTVTRVYKITPAPLTVNTAEASKYFDGTPLTKEDGCTIEGLVKGETATLKVTGSQTEVGASTNTYEIIWDQTAKAGNYQIVDENLGTLTVMPTYMIQVVHQFAPGNESDTTLPADYTLEYVKPNTSMLIEAEAVDGYVAQPTGQTVQVVDQDMTVTILYYKDTIGTDPTNPDKPDGIPDDYQVVVRFEAENGTVNFDHTVVTLYDANGNPAANGVGHMSPFRIAAARANDGYDQASLSWTPGVPAPEYDITEAMTFRAVFTAATTPTPGNPDNTNPTNPDNSNPSNGGGTSGGGTDDTTPAGDTTPQAAPAANTPAVVNATPAAVNPVTNFINNVVNPVVDTVRDRVADIQEILNSDDDQVPLADQKLDDHKCCILHFLIMLLALIISIFETRSMKKRQKKLQEVREELDCELARRGLPVTSERQ